MTFTIITPSAPFADIREAAFAEERVDWWDDSQKKAQTACTLCWASTELEKYLPGETMLREAGKGLNGLAGTVVLLGNADMTPEIAALEAKTGRKLTADDGIPAEGFRMCACTVDGVRYIVLSGSDRAGIMYAAFACCERFGVTFVEPGEACVRPSDDDGGDFDVTETPDYETRGTMSSYVAGDAPFLEWMAHNRFNNACFRRADSGFALRKKLCIQTELGGHQMMYLFVEASQEYPYRHAVYGGEGKPDDPYPVSTLCRKPSGQNGCLTYGDAHPEWYALVDGERRERRFVERFIKDGNAPGDNLCTSNEDAMTELAKRVTESLIDGVWKYADYINAWPLDNGVWCECEACRAQGNYTTRMLMMAHRINQEIARARREGRLKRPVKLVCPVYHETLPKYDKALPADFDYSSCLVVFYPIERCYAHNIDDPVCRETNALFMDMMKPWSEHARAHGGLMIGEYYNVSSFVAMPFVLTSRILNDIPAYYRMGARHFHYMHITARDWGFIGMNNWLYGKMLWKTSQDGEALLNRFFSARYGDLAGEMRALYERVEKSGANCKFYKHYQFTGSKSFGLCHGLDFDHPTADELFPSAHMKLDGRSDDPQAGPSLHETLTGFESELDDLRRLDAQDGQTRLNLERDERRLAYGVRMTRFLELMARCAVMGYDGSLVPTLREAAETLENSREGLKGYDFGVNMENELNASWAGNKYWKRFGKRRED